MDGMDREAIAETFLGRDIERERAIGRIHARNADAFWTSRHLADPSRFNVLLHFVQDVIELTACNVALHLLVPFVILPTVKPGCKLSTLFKRELFDRSLDFG